MIFKVFNDLSSFSSRELHKAMSALPEWRLHRVEKYHFEIDRKLSTIGYMLLRDILFEQYGIASLQEWEYNADGKPYLGDYPSLHFNISHCHTGVACVVDSSPVGVDIESIRPFDLELAEHICNSSELFEIKTANNPAVEFTKLWTIKESYLKYLGVGLVDALPALLDKALEVNFQTTICEEHGYVMTICTVE